jgi:TetR/AcrR family transcriptional repressor of nem operon
MSYGRPLEYDPAKALDAAMQLFWSKGYEATSLNDLLIALGLSKSSLYQGFGGKKELFLRCINRYCDNYAGLLLDFLNKAESGRTFIEETLLMAANEARKPDMRRGCLLVNTASEFAQSDPAVAERVTTGLDRFKGVFLAAVTRGQQEGSITTTLEADLLAGYLMCCMGGLKTVVKGGADEQKVKDIVGVIMRALE